MALAVGCVPQYRPPQASDPHAVVKIRRTYDAAPSQYLRERVMINDHEGLSETHQGLDAPRTNALLVHPGNARWSVHAVFYHMEMRTVPEQYTEQQPYTDSESYDCSTGLGTTRNYRTCTRPVTRYRTLQKTRYVPRNVEVVEGECGQSVAHQALVGGVYVLQFRYLDHGSCQLECYDQGRPGQHCPAAVPE